MAAEASRSNTSLKTCEVRPLTDDRRFVGYERSFTDTFARHIGSVDGASSAFARHIGSFDVLVLFNLNGNIDLKFDGLDINGSDLFLVCGLLLLSDNCADKQGSGK